MTPMTGSGQSTMSDDNMTMMLQKLEDVEQLQKAAASVASAPPSVFLSTDSKPTVQLSEINSSAKLNEATENVHNLRARGQDPRSEHVLTGKLMTQIKEGMIPEADQNIFETSRDVLEVLQKLLLAATKREQILKGAKVVVSTLDAAMQHPISLECVYDSQLLLDTVTEHLTIDATLTAEEQSNTVMLSALRKPFKGLLTGFEPEQHSTFMALLPSPQTTYKHLFMGILKVGNQLQKESHRKVLMTPKGGFHRRPTGGDADMLGLKQAPSKDKYVWGHNGCYGCGQYSLVNGNPMHRQHQCFAGKPGVGAQQYAHPDFNDSKMPWHQSAKGLEWKAKGHNVLPYDKALNPFEKISMKFEKEGGVGGKTAGGLKYQHKETPYPRGGH